MNAPRIEIVGSRIDTPRNISRPCPREYLLGFIIVIGTTFMLANRSLPIGRNAFCYAKAALGIIQHHFRLTEVARDLAWTSGKPILFSTLAAPFVWASNANIGTMLASVVGTAFFLWMTVLALPRLNGKVAIDPRLTSIELLFVGFNPLVIYQFWSAYPDSLFAGFVLLAFVLTDVIATDPKRDTQWHIVGLGVTIDLAIHTKLYGAVLGICCPVYLAVHYRNLAARPTQSLKKLVLLVIVFAALGLDLIAAKLGINPLLDFADGGGFGPYLSGARQLDGKEIVGSLAMLLFATVLSFHVALLLLLRRAAWRVWKLAPTLFFAVYLMGLLTFPGTDYNMRYFIPAFPLLAPAMASGLRSVGPLARRTMLGLYGAIATVLVLIFNLADVERLVQPKLTLALGHYPRLELFLDNLRLPAQIEFKQRIDAINAVVPQGSVLYWSSDYYDTATHGLAEHLGVKKGLQIRYVLNPSQISQSADSVYITELSSFERLRHAPRWASARHIGTGLFRLDPITIELTSLSGDWVDENRTVRLQAKINTVERLKARAVQFFEGERELGTGQVEPVELNWPHPTPGRHEIVAQVQYDNAELSTSDPIVIFVGVPSLERRASADGYAAIELSDGEVFPANDTIEMLADNNLVAVRFDHLNIARNTSIAAAYLRFVNAIPISESATFQVEAELSGDSPPLQFVNGDISRRRRSTSSVKWNSKSWGVVKEIEQTPDLGPLVEEVLAQSDWIPGRAITFFIHGSGRRVARSYEGDDPKAPTLYVELKRN